MTEAQYKKRIGFVTSLGGAAMERAANLAQFAEASAQNRDPSDPEQAADKRAWEMFAAEMATVVTSIRNDALMMFRDADSGIQLVGANGVPPRGMG